MHSPRNRQLEWKEAIIVHSKVKLHKETVYIHDGGTGRTVATEIVHTHNRRN